MVSEDLKEIIKLYPGLIYTQKEGKKLLKGTFEFCALYDTIEDKFILNPLINDNTDTRIIQDYYEIEVEFLSDYPQSFPEVREVGNRIQKIKEKYNIDDIRVLHVNKNKNNTVCLCPRPEEYLRYPNGIDILDFFNALVLPYFYGLSYYEKYGRWSRDEYGHGDIGIFEFYVERRDGNINLVESCLKSISENTSKDYLSKKDKIKGHWDCICGSKKRMRDCHGKALEGMRLLKDDIKHTSVKLGF